MLFCAGASMAQDKKADKVAEKAAKKAEKEAKKAAEEAEQMALFEQGVQALKDKDFVLEADRVEFKRGQFVYVTPSTNFVSMQGDHATIQLAFNIPVSGPNGIGGITVDGECIKHRNENRQKRERNNEHDGAGSRSFGKRHHPHGKRLEQMYGDGKPQFQQ